MALSPNQSSILSDPELAQLNLEKKLSLVVNFEFDKETRKRALKKLSEAAKNYDGSKTAINLDSFNSKALKPEVFRELLKQAFNLRLDSSEIGAVLSETGNAAGGFIEGDKFLKYFLKLGHNLRDKERAQQRQKKLSAETEEKLKLEQKKKKIDEKIELLIDYDYGEADEARAMEKIGMAAKDYDKTHPAAVSLDAFQCHSLSPASFKDVLRRTLNVYLSAKELASLVTLFDKEGDGMINCHSLLVKFIQMGTELRNADRAKIISERKKAENSALFEKERKTAEAEPTLGDVEALTVTPEARQSAQLKLREAAAK